MDKLLKNSLISHTNYITPRIHSDKKRLDFYKTMWYYIKSSNFFNLVPPPFKNLSPGDILAKEIYEMIYNSLKERFE